VHELTAQNSKGNSNGQFCTGTSARILMVKTVAKCRNGTLLYSQTTWDL